PLLLHSPCGNNGDVQRLSIEFVSQDTSTTVSINSWYYAWKLAQEVNFHAQAVSLSLSSEHGSVPIDWRLYLPEKWAKDRQRRKKAGVPEELKFQTKPQIALEQIRAAKAAGVAIGIVLADAGYGNETAWREALEGMEL